MNTEYIEHLVVYTRFLRNGLMAASSYACNLFFFQPGGSRVL